MFCFIIFINWKIIVKLCKFTILHTNNIHNFSLNKPTIYIFLQTTTNTGGFSKLVQNSCYVLDVSVKGVQWMKFSYSIIFNWSLSINLNLNQLNIKHQKYIKFHSTCLIKFIIFRLFNADLTCSSASDIKTFICGEI